MKNITRIINVILIILIAAVWMLEAHILTQAQEGAAAPSAAEPAGEEAADEIERRVEEIDIAGRCVTRMKDFMAVKSVEFGEFINLHFRSGSSTSELIPSAIERYRAYRKEIMGEMNRMAPVSSQTASAAMNERPPCEKAVKTELALMKQLLSQHISENAYAKKSTRLIDKYKNINKKLEELSFTIAQMYGYFGALSGRLPCYATGCIKG